MAFYVGGGPLKYWTDFNWEMLTHLVIFGAADKDMINHAHSMGVKVLVAHTQSSRNHHKLDLLQIYIEMADF